MTDYQLKALIMMMIEVVDGSKDKAEALAKLYDLLDMEDA